MSCSAFAGAAKEWLDAKIISADYIQQSTKF